MYVCLSVRCNLFSPIKSPKNIVMDKERRQPLMAEVGFSTRQRQLLMWHFQFLIYTKQADEPTDVKSPLHIDICNTLQMRCHPRDKVEMSHVLVISPFKLEHSNAALRQK